MTTALLPANRRSFLQGAAATSALALMPAMARAAAPNDFRAMIDGFADEILVLSPETATGLGIDTGTRAPLKSHLSQISAADQANWEALVRSVKTRLATVNRESLSPADRNRFDTLNYAADRGIEGAKFKYGGGAAAGFYGGTSPYVVSQQNGAVSSVPEFLNSQHGIKSKADADAYVARVEEFARLIDQETAQIAVDAGNGIAPPDFIASNALGQLKGFRATAAKDQGLVTSIAERTAKAGLTGDWAAQVTKLIDSKIYPAVDREIAAFAAATAKSGSVGSVSRLLDGEAYYRWALRLGTTTTNSPDEVHQIGLEQNREIMGRMDALLKAQDMTKGTVGERVTALNKDPKFVYPNTDAGRANLIADLNRRIAAVRPIMPKLSHLKLNANVTVKRVPPDIQDGASLGYMNFASLDGSRPAIYYVNLKSTSLWPKYQLASLTAHEAIPGHAWQGAYLAEHHDEVPLITSMIGFNAFVEGWALYAEQIIDESGLYDQDPFSRLGYLQAQQFRACRLVVDTGLHAKGWTRQQAIDFLTQNTGKGADAMTSEIDRYCASPGQACGYKMGHNELLRLRAKAKAALGSRFDLAAFNDAVVMTGGVPLPILESVVDGYVKGVKA